MVTGMMPDIASASAWVGGNLELRLKVRVSHRIHQQTAYCENLAKFAKRKTYLRNLAKLVFAKPCETRICETLRILRNKRKTERKGFENRSSCETRICENL